MLVDRVARLSLIGLVWLLAVTAIFGGLVVVPHLPIELLAGSPFSDYAIPAVALAGIVGGGALVAAMLLALRPNWGLVVSAMIGVAMMLFEVVETSVIGLDFWLRALGLSPTLGPGMPGFDSDSVPAPLGIPLPLWLQPFYFAYGAVVVTLAVRLWGHRTRFPEGIAARKLPLAAVRPAAALLIFGALFTLFVVVLHPWLISWGSTPEERSMVLPGDTAAPETYFTRAITIDAPPSSVWPWLLAIGQDRAGFLSNDYLENLTGADNADSLRPEWQQRAVGDRVPMASPGMRALGGDVTSTTIRILVPQRVIADTPGRFVLLPSGDAMTRLLLRESLEDPLRSGEAWMLWDPMHFVMEKRMLQGIKERAEGRPLVSPVVKITAYIGWTVAAVGLFGLFLYRRTWRSWLGLPVSAVLPALWFAGDVNSVLAGFLAVGITVAGCLAFGWRWWPPYLLIASAVALVLLLAPDSFSAFGLIFLALVASAGGAVSGRQMATVRPSQALRSRARTIAS